MLPVILSGSSFLVVPAGPPPGGQAGRERLLFYNFIYLLRD